LKLNDLHLLYKETLVQLYPGTEISSFFYLLCEEILNFDKATVALEYNMSLSKNDLAEFTTYLTRLKTGEPIQYCIGKTNFYGFDFFVTHDTLIPRPETEELVEWIIDDLKEINTHVKIIDIGTGSGCIAISLSKELKNATVSALDFSIKALKIAENNTNHNQAVVTFHHIDILATASLPDNYDVIVSNPPYVKQDKKAEMHQNVLKFEPENALFVPNHDPLVFYRKIGVLAQKHLKRGGYLYFEINQHLGQQTIDLLTKELNFTAPILQKDFLGNDRMLRVQK